MTNASKLALVMLGIVGCQYVLRGQSTSDSTAVPSLTIESARAKLSFLVGTFFTTIHIPPPPSKTKGADGSGSSVVNWALDSTFLLIDDQSVNPMIGQYKAHGVLGYDPQVHQYALSMFNNFGDYPSYHGEFSGDTLVLRTKVAAPRGSFDQKLLWYKDGKAVKLEVLNDFGKGFLPALVQTAVPVHPTNR